MNVILFLFMGLVVGLLARAIMPGRQAMGLLETMLLGIVGSFVGGFFAALVTHRRVLEFSTSGLVGSVLGALLVLFVYTRVTAGRRPLGPRNP